MDGETVLGKETMKGTVYPHLTYADGLQTYTITTCTQDDYNDNIWHVKDGNTISIKYIYGADYPEVWDFGGNPILFFNGASTFNVYPTLYTKITPDGSTLKKATISTVSCSVWADLKGLEDNGHYLTGSCTLSGSAIPATQLGRKVPAGCRLP